MISRQEKIRRLKKFYNSVTIGEQKKVCPFGKNFNDEDSITKRMECLDLCGTWTELGDVRRGCPCHTLGSGVALIQLHHILQREGKNIAS